MSWNVVDYSQSNGWYRPKPAGGGGYTGPGDIVTFNAWWGLRAYSAAKAAATAPSVDLFDQAGANRITINVKTNGALDTTAISTWVAANTVTTIKVTKFWDQVGTDHMVQATLAAMPTLTLTSGPGGVFPALLFAAASSQTMTAGVNSGGSQPISISAVVDRTGSTGSFNTVLAFGGGEMLFDATANSLGGYAGGVLADAVHSADSSFHAAQVLFAATGKVVIDGNTPVTGSIGSGIITGNYVIGNGIGGFLDGRLCETGIAASDLSANFNALNSNQHGANGYNF